MSDKPPRQDHMGKDLPTPAVLRKTKSHVFVDAGDPTLKDRREDAGFHVDVNATEAPPPWSGPPAMLVV